MVSAETTTTRDAHVTKDGKWFKCAACGAMIARIHRFVGARGLLGDVHTVELRESWVEDGSGIWRPNDDARAEFRLGSKLADGTRRRRVADLGRELAVYHTSAQSWAPLAPCTHGAIIPRSKLPVIIECLRCHVENVVKEG